MLQHLNDAVNKALSAGATSCDNATDAAMDKLVLSLKEAARRAKKSNAPAGTKIIVTAGFMGTALSLEMCVDDVVDDDVEILIEDDSESAEELIFEGEPNDSTQCGG